MANCRICDNKISEFMSFGDMPIANGFLTKEQFENEYFFEMKVAFCEKCFMFQLVEQPEAILMFHENYAFFSQSSKSMCQHFANHALKIQNKYINSEDPFVVELGSNDGILLQNFAKKNIRHLGIEPSKNVAEVAIKNGVNTISCFFNEFTAKEVLEEHGKADIVTSANVMCHIADLNSVAKGISLLLKDDGYLIFEDPYLADVFKKTSYDQIYDEHIFLFSCLSVKNAFEKHGLNLVDCEHLDTHGGSMRYILTKSKYVNHSANLKKYLTEEEELGLNLPDTFLRFKQNCEISKTNLINTLQDLSEKNADVAGYAATSKSTTILNYCNIDSNLIKYICDTTPIKQGKYSPGMHIPIVPYEDFLAKYPEYAVLFAWNHAQEIMLKEEQFVNQGGKWIVFFPKVEILQETLRVS